MADDPYDEFSGSEALVKADKPALVRRSAALARRGLEALRPAFRLVRFPRDTAIGTLHVYTDSSAVPSLSAEAKGEVRVPGGARLSLSIEVEGLHGLALLQPDDLDDIGVIAGQKPVVSLSPIGRMTGLHHLWISKALGLADSHVDALRPLVNLRTMNIGRNPNIGNAALVSIGHLTGLEWLNLSSTGVTSAGLPHLQHLQRLSWLSLEKTAVDDSGAPWLRKLKALQTLDLSYTRMSDSGLKIVANLPELKRIRVMGSAVSPAGIKSTKEVSPSCAINVPEIKDPEVVRKQLGYMVAAEKARAWLAFAVNRSVAAGLARLPSGSDSIESARAAFPPGTKLEVEHYGSWTLGSDLGSDEMMTNLGVWMLCRYGASRDVTIRWVNGSVLKVPLETWGHKF